MSDEYIADEFEHAGFKVKIIQDTDPGNPREEWDNFGRMVCWHRRYNLGDCEVTKRAFKKPCAADGTRFDDNAEFQEWWKEHGEGGVILPLYLYDHSGITMSCSGFSCPWDSGQVGWIYATKDQIREEFSGDAALAEKCLRQEVETYDQYLTGDVYGYVIEDEDGNDLDSLWGMFGLDYCKQEAMESAEYVAESRQENPDFAI